MFLVLPQYTGVEFGKWDESVLFYLGRKKGEIINAKSMHKMKKTSLS